MIGLGAPGPEPTPKPDIDKLRQLEERVEKLEKMSVWIKIAIAFLGLFILTNKKIDK